MDYEIKPIYGHYEVYINGKFYCSADNVLEAEMEILEAELAILNIANNTKLI